MKKAAKLGADGGVLPTDVLYEVLLRLPAKEVCRVRLVCRRWRSLTSDPVFARDHGSRHQHLVGLHGDLGEVHVLDLSGNIQKRIRLEHGFCTSWNAQLDLICVRVDWGKACVLDLATGAVVADIGLPEQNEPLPRFVLGHVPTTGVYKLLCLNYRIKSHHQVTYRRQACSVLTLLDGSSSRWRARPDAPAPTVPSSRYIALIRGAAYFVVMNSEPDISIASFDFAAEEWTRIIQGPVVSSRKDVFYTSFTLAALGDCLVAAHNNHRGMSVDLWFMDDMEHSLWTKRYSVHREQPPLRFATFCPLAVVSDDDDGMVIFFWVENANVVRAYHLNMRTWTDVTSIRTKDYSALGTHYGGSLLALPRN
jgi:F-box interacting protein